MKKPNEMNDRIKETESYLRAISFAARAHDLQKRKDGKTPYASHPFRVSVIARDVFNITDARVLAAAVLHDTIEDTTTDYDDLEEEFGAEVADWVGILSKDKRMKDEQREAAYCEQLKTAPDEVKLIKLADILDNLLDSASQPDLALQTKTVSRAQYYLGQLSAGASSRVKQAIDIVKTIINQTKEV